MTPTQIGFLSVALIAVLAAVGVVFWPSPIRAVMSLVVNILSLAVLYFMLGSELLGVTQIMVYAGAIMVLFLFVVMMLRLKDEPMTAQGLLSNRWLTGASVVIILGLFIYALGIRPVEAMSPSFVSQDYGTPQAIGRELFTNYAWPFEIASMLLLVGIVGSIILAKRRH